MRRVEQYRICTRVIVPLAMLSYAGFVTGQVAYYHAGHLGLLSGPLGSLRGLGPRVNASSAWGPWLLAALFLAAFLVERRRVKKRGVRPGDPYLQAGYFLGALWMLVRPQVSGSKGREALESLAVLSAMALVAGTWRRWRTPTRALAVVLFVATALLAAWVARRDDPWRLRSAQETNLQSLSASVTDQETAPRQVGAARVGRPAPRP